MAIEIAPHLTLGEARCRCHLKRKKIEAYIGKNGNEFGEFCYGKFGSEPNEWDQKLLELWVKYRERLGNKPLTVNSGARCKAYNKYIYIVEYKKKPTSSQHLNLKALDIAKVSWMSIDEMAKIAAEVGFMGIGKYPNFIHVDVRPSADRWDER